LSVEGADAARHSSSTVGDCDRLYPRHIPTSLFQKMLLSVGSAAMAITCPWRGGMQLPVWTYCTHMCGFLHGCWQSVAV